MTETAVQDLEQLEDLETNENSVDLSRPFSKSKLMEFIDRYYLGGHVEHVKWEVENNTLSTSFISSDKSLVGNLSMDNFNMEDAELGIYNAAKIIKLIKILDENLDITVNSIDGKAMSLDFEDDFKEVNFRLGDLSVIPDTPKLKQLPDFTIEVEIDDSFIDHFTSSEKALPDSDVFAVEATTTELKVILGYSQMGNTNKVVLNPKNAEYEATDTVSFNSTIFREILSANKGSDSGTWEISGEGLSRITFNKGDFDVTYYLVAKSDAI